MLRAVLPPLVPAALGAAVGRGRRRQPASCKDATVPPLDVPDLQRRWQLVTAGHAKDPAVKRHEGLAVTPWFRQQSAQLFRNMEVKDSDVIMVSLPKCGTTWTHQILFCLLRMDDHGRLPVSDEADPAANSQVYPEGVPAERPADEVYPFGFSSWQGLEDQRQPRLFSTHLVPPMIPAEGLRQRGRLVYVLRNPKDCLASWHFFMKAQAEYVPPLRPRVEEGWTGSSEDGTLGTFGRFNFWPPEMAPEFFGSYYWHCRQMGELIGQLGPERAAVVYYENLQGDFDGEVRKLATFLGVPLSEEKLAAIQDRVGFQNMKERHPIKTLFRKGGIGDFKNHLSAEYWWQMDKWFDERLGDVAIAQPLRKWM